MTDELYKRNLAAAILAITTEAGKVGYLYPAPKRALARYVNELEVENTELEVENAGLKERNAELQKQLAKLEYKVIKLDDIAKPQPFHMVVEK